MKTPVAAALASLALASTPTLAADLFGPAAPPLTSPASQNPLAEVGSSWYLRGDVGVSLEQAPSFSMATDSMPPAGGGVLPFSSTFGSSKWRDNFGGDIGLGYRYNNWLRLEGIWDYRTGPAGSNRNSVVCPTTLTAEPTGGPYTGYLYDTSSTCTGDLYLHQRNTTALAAAYLDLGDYWGVTPYVGAGAGVNVNMINGNVAYTVDATQNSYTGPTSGGITAPNVWVNSGGVALNPQPGANFTNQGWDRSISSVKYSMAWALMAGFGVQLSPSVTLDVGYRYLDAGTTNVPITTQIGSTVKQSNVSQDIRVGIRLMAN